VHAVTRIAIVDPQPAVRAGLAMLLRTEPGLVPVGAANGVHDGLELVERLRPAVVVLEHHLRDGDGLSLTRRLKTLPRPPQVIVYTAEPDGALVLLARVAGADGLVDKAAAPEDLFDAIRVVARGETSLPPLEVHDLDAAAHRIDPEDLALLAMLVDGTPVVDAADTLRLDRRKVGHRIERMLGRLRAGSPAAA
jgi:DNA-binding NarL/FixJ family response regulator